MKTIYHKTPLGICKISGDTEGLTAVSILDDNHDVSTDIPEELKDCVVQLDEYFQGSRTLFDLQINPQGTDFQKKVWNALLQIPYGKTTSYLDQAKQLGDVKAIRAVAAANGKNPLWIIIPCHRVVGSDGSLTGYAGGIWRKKWLLAHENPVKQTSLF